MKMTTILVPYDGSQPSEKALKYAAEMVKNNSAKSRKMILLHIIEEMPMAPVFENRFRSRKTGEAKSLSEQLVEVYQEMKEAAEKHLEAKKSDIEWILRGTENTNVEVKVMIGKPVDIILKVAEAEKADLIVIGNVGLSGLSKLKTLGSVSRAVSERAPCPVVIIH